MNTEYLTKEIERYTILIQEDEKKQALIFQNIKYYKKQLKNAENALKELNAHNIPNTTQG
jgi:hypothetical protein